jgi:predicted carbohydrate-binding protein with CBM5 and CBM33 domain
VALRPEPSFTTLLAKTVTVVAALTLILIGGLSGSAQAHGSLTDPPSRNYGCWERWGDDHLNPDMANQDPMCWQAWQADPNAMWNWNGLYREGAAGNHQGVVPDGQLCSGGRTQAPRYNALDAVGAWKTVDKPNQFTLTLTDQAQHGADYIRVYITKQGFNSATQPLTWGNLELVTTSPRIPSMPAYQVAVNAGNRTGRHVLYAVWQASHLDQSYYLCSDINFTGGGGTDPTPTPTPTVDPTATPTVTPTPTTTPTTPGTTGCTATMRTSWSGGFQAEVTVTANSAAISSWTVGWSLASGQGISSLWSGTSTVSGSNVTVKNAAWNGAVAAGQSTTFGFIGSGSPSTPALTCSA